MGFPKQEYWNELPFPSPGDLPNPGVEPESPLSTALQADSLHFEPSETQKNDITSLGLHYKCPNRDSAQVSQFHEQEVPLPYDPMSLYFCPKQENTISSLWSKNHMWTSLDFCLHVAKPIRAWLWQRQRQRQSVQMKRTFQGQTWVQNLRQIQFPNACYAKLCAMCMGYDCGYEPILDCSLFVNKASWRFSHARLFT